MNFDPNPKLLHKLLLNSSFENDIGLFYGKMGIIIFFSHYFKTKNNPLFEDTASELMDELLNEIHENLPVGFASGSAGIGWGIEYLIQNGFMEGDSLDICEEVDIRIMERDPRRIKDYSIEIGLGGILHYVLAHIKGVMAQHSKPPFDETYLNDLYQTVSNIPEGIELPEEFKELSTEYINFYKNRKELDYNLSLSFIIEKNKIENPRKPAKSALSAFHPPLGLRNGISGYLLNHLL